MLPETFFKKASERINILFFHTSNVIYSFLVCENLFKGRHILQSRNNALKGEQFIHPRFFQPHCHSFYDTISHSYWNTNVFSFEWLSWWTKFKIDATLRKTYISRYKQRALHKLRWQNFRPIPLPWQVY